MVMPKAKSIYIVGSEPRSGKSVVLLGIMELLSRQVQKLGFFRPIIQGLKSPVNDLSRRRHRDGHRQYRGHHSDPGAGERPPVMKVLVINSGSSSIKYEVFEASNFNVLSSGLLERIGESESQHTHRLVEASGRVKETVRRGRVKTHEEAFRFILDAPADPPVIEDPSEILGITVDDGKNEKPCEEVLEIQCDGGPVKVLVVRTQEEREIAEQTVAALLKFQECGVIVR